jgi:CobQ-like glutamine amidotransferase family enzyme
VTALTAALVHPLLNTAAGDDANGLALAHRAAQRDLEVDVVTVHGDRPVPIADVYLLGGTGQVGVRALAQKLAESDVFTGRVRDGAVVVAIDAGLDALGRGIADQRGQIIAPSLGLLPFTTERGSFVAEPVVSHPRPDLGLPSLGGWVQHRVALRADPDVESFVELEVGHGDRGRHDGVMSGHVLGSRLHGPLLGRNPEVADLVLAWATDRGPLSWPALPPGAAERARDLRADEDRATERRDLRHRLRRSRSHA